MTLTGEQFSIAAGEHRVTVVEVGAGLRSYSCGARPVTVEYPPDSLTPKACGAVLIPWPNRIRNGRYSFDGADYQLALSEPPKGNASHGLARWDRWSVLRHDPDSIALAIDVVPQSGWPFELRAEVTYRVDAAAGLRVEARVENTGRRRLPLGVGFHPYIDVRATPMDDVCLRFTAQERLLTDDSSIPVGRTSVPGTEYDRSAGRPLGALRLDDAFTGLPRVSGRVTVDVRAGDGPGAQLWFDESFGFTQVYTLENLQPGVNGVAVEPMTCPADAFNSGEGLIVLEPGGSWSGTWGITPLD